MTPRKILVVDDDRNLLHVLRMRLESEQYHVTTAADERAARDAASVSGFDLAILDLQLVNEDGISLMGQLRHSCPDLPVIILTAHGSIESAVEAMRRGAFTYLTKPFEAQDLLLEIERALENRKFPSEIDQSKEPPAGKHDFSNIVGISKPLKQVLETVDRIAGTDSTVYIQGESGTGKELVARALHNASGRRDRPFVAVNCAALPEALLESELFGHEKGAFTGAIRSSRGLFVQADQGTIFLDEIGDMPLSIQAKFLRVLQERQFHPVGGEGPVQVDVRVIVATNKNLAERVKQGLFRDDLYYRIRVIPLELPPLRSRKEDIPLLARFFLTKYAGAMAKDIKAFSPSAMARLMSYEWPGNVRELENTIEYAVAMAHEDILSDDLILTSSSSDSGGQVQPLKEARSAFEKNYLIHLLELTNGTVSSAAHLAGKYRADFYNLLKKHGIDPGHFKKQQ